MPNTPQLERLYESITRNLRSNYLPSHAEVQAYYGNRRYTLEELLRKLEPDDPETNKTLIRFDKEFKKEPFSKQ